MSANASVPDFAEIDAARGFRRYRSVGDVVYLSGHIPDVPATGFISGRLGDELTVSDGYVAARGACLNLMASVSHAAGGLDQVRSVLKVVGFVACDPAFTELPEVIDGASDVIVELLGAERGLHSRSAIGVAALPLGAPVEIEAVIRVGRPS
jgi:enamine deaminase RidA (YjgF/YER057c/UK114 family)